MRTKPGWHGYWLNPGDAGLPMRRRMAASAGRRCVGPLRYPVPTRLTIAGLMNYVYERDYAVLVRLKVPAGASGRDPDPRRGALARLHRQGLRARSRGRSRSTCRSAPGPPTRARAFDEWRRALPRPLAPRRSSRSRATACARHPAARQRRRSASPISSRPTTARSTMPRRSASAATATRCRRAQAAARRARRVFAACSRSATGAGWSSRAVPGAVPEGGAPGRRIWRERACCWRSSARLPAGSCST